MNWYGWLNISAEIQIGVKYELIFRENYVVYYTQVFSGLGNLRK